jgi:hypothetical protein
MSGQLWDDVRAKTFCDYVLTTAWNILNEQGYAMERYRTYFSELWCQEHFKRSHMEQHIHGNGAQLVGFYFLDCPENSSRLVIHDPRPSKVITNLPQRNIGDATFGSNEINFVPQPGMLVFTNAWLPHSFSRHGSDEPLRFVHFNINVREAPVCVSEAEIV